AALPFGPGGDERGYAVDESTTGLERLLRIKLRRQFRANRKVGYEHIDIGPAQFGGDVDRRHLCFLDHVVEIFADPVERLAPLHDDTGGLDIGKAMRVVWGGIDRLGDVLADLGAGDIESGSDFDIAHTITAEINMHQPGHGLVA